MEDHYVPREKLLLALVGLPARGKSYVAHKIVGFLRWMNTSAEIFNVGKFRRDRVEGTHQADFFSAGNADAKAQREALAMGVLEMAADWLRDGGSLAVFDATNTTRARRAAIVDYCKARTDVSISVVFIESICDDEAVLASNLAQKARCSPDYRDMPLEAALADLRQRIANYERVYESVEDSEGVSYVKIINLRSKIVCHRLHGPVMHRIVALLMSVHIGSRPIWLTRAGEVAHAKVMDDDAREALIRQHVLTRTVSNVQDLGVALANGGGGGDPWDGAPTGDRRTGADEGEGEGEEEEEEEGQVTSAAAAFAMELAEGPGARRTPAAATAVPAVPAAPAAPASQAPAYHTDSAGLSTTAQLVARGGLLSMPPIARMPHSTTAALKLSAGGRAYGAALAAFVSRRAAELGFAPESVLIHTSTATRAIQTARALGAPCTWSTLNALDTGALHGMSVDEIRRRMPREHAAWMAKPFTTRIPGGESYADGMRRLQPFVIELERETQPLLIVTHLSTLQLLYGYFKGVPPDKIPFLSFPAHTVVELRPSQYGWEEQHVRLEGVSDMAQEAHQDAVGARDGDDTEEPAGEVAAE